LADFKVPREVYVVADLPRVTLDKIDKKALYKQLRESLPSVADGHPKV
jgi:non-ribosomal peptide synthetase component E (peptide arylation enzyme)